MTIKLTFFDYWVGVSAALCLRLHGILIHFLPLPLKPACSVRHIVVCWGLTFCWILPWSVNKEWKTCEISTNSERRRIHPFDLTRKKNCVMSKSRALILAICVSFLIFSHLHLSFVNLNNQSMRVIIWWYHCEFYI